MLIFVNIPRKGAPVISPCLVLIHLLANSYVSVDTCVLASDVSTPNSFMISMYFSATLSLLMTMSSPSSMYESNLLTHPALSAAHCTTMWWLKVNIGHELLAPIGCPTE